MPALVTATIAALLGLCWTAVNPVTWAHYGYLYRHSLAVHVMTIDLTLLTLMSPFLVVADARARGVRFARSAGGMLGLGLAMLGIPWVGPGVYLLLRTITPHSGSSSRRRGVGGGAGGSIRGWFNQLVGRASHFLSSWKSVTSAAGTAQAAAEGVQEGVRTAATRGSRQLRHNTAAAVNAAAAGSSAAAANVAAAAAVPLPADAAATAGGVAAAVGSAAGTVAGRLQQGWGRVKQGAVGLFAGRGGYPGRRGAAADAAGAGRTASGDDDDVFEDYPGGGCRVLRAEGFVCWVLWAGVWGRFHGGGG